VVQLRLEQKLTVAEYVTQRAWESATLAQCPLHPEGGCGICRHGTYPRKFPEPLQIARAYCAKGKTTFSLLPDCLASRLPGELDAVEQAAAAVEAKGVAKAAEELRPAAADAVTSISAERWARRRAAHFKGILAAVIGLLPDRLAGISTVSGLRDRLGTVHALRLLREIAASHLHALPPPLGFGPRPRRRVRRGGSFQHDQGPDPPPSAR